MKLHNNMKNHLKALLSLILLFLVTESIARKKTQSHRSVSTRKTGSTATIKMRPADASKSESAVTTETGPTVQNKIGSLLTNKVGSVHLHLNNGDAPKRTNDTGPAVPNMIGSLLTNGIGPMGPNLTESIGTNDTGPAFPNKIGSILMNKIGSILTNGIGPIGPKVNGPTGTNETGPTGTNDTGPTGPNEAKPVGPNQTEPAGTGNPESIATNKPALGSISTNKIKTGDPTWGYGVSGTGYFGPADWDKMSPQCKGSNQSPIDIFPQATPFKLACKSMLLESDNKLGLVTGVLSNTGHSAQFTVNEKDGMVFLSGGPADSAHYKLSSIRFHVGCMDGSGSEHTLNFKPASAEMQMIFYNKKYKNINEAVSQPDGVTIISSLFDYYGGLTYYHNPTLERLISFLPNITKPGSSVNLDHDERIELTKLVPELTRDCPHYYTYKGSLTTPPCYESVTWILLKTRLTISIQQLGQFRQLQDRDGNQLCDNFRPIQPTNNREVTKNFLQDY